MSDPLDLPSQALGGAGLLASVVLIGLAAVGGATAEAAMAPGFGVLAFFIIAFGVSFWRHGLNEQGDDGKLSWQAAIRWERLGREVPSFPLAVQAGPLLVATAAFVSGHSGGFPSGFLVFEAGGCGLAAWWFLLAEPAARRVFTRPQPTPQTEPDQTLNERVVEGEAENAASAEGTWITRLYGVFCLLCSAILILLAAWRPLATQWSLTQLAWISGAGSLLLAPHLISYKALGLMQIDGKAVAEPKRRRALLAERCRGWPAVRVVPVAFAIFVFLTGFTGRPVLEFFCSANAAMAALSGGWFLLVQPEAKRLFGGGDNAEGAD